MHFSKTYTQLLSSLPPELRENAIQYRQVGVHPTQTELLGSNPDLLQLKKLINQIVNELSSLGLSPRILQEHLERSKEEVDALSQHKGKDKLEGSSITQEDTQALNHTYSGHSTLSRVVYELAEESGHLEPHLKLWWNAPIPDSRASTSRSLDEDTPSSNTDPSDVEPSQLEDDDQPRRSLLWALQDLPTSVEPQDSSVAPGNAFHPAAMYALTPLLVQCSLFDSQGSTDISSGEPIIINSQHSKNEQVITLTADLLFFNTLQTALEHLSDHMTTVQSDFVDTLKTLSGTIASAARPVSQTNAGFKPHSVLSSQPWAVHNVSHSKVRYFCYLTIVC
jgi:hypothetical protein